MAAPLVNPVLCPVMLGRGPFLTALQCCVDEVAAGQGRAVLVSGEAGIGKSRLISEIGTYAGGRGFQIITGHCFEQDEALPYAPLIDALRAILKSPYGERAVEALQPFASEVSRVVPELSDLFSTTGAPELDTALDPKRDKRRIVQAFTLLVSEVATIQPLLLCIEDLHWCDESSLDALLHLARELASLPVLLVLTYRSDEVPGHLTHMLTQLDRERLAAEMRLDPLGISDVEGMLRAIFGLSHTVQADQLNLVYGLSDGNPFFVEEMLRTLASADTTALSPNILTKRLALDALRVPRTVDEAVGRRVSELSSAARQLVALAAVAGRSFTFALLQTLTQQHEEHILEQLKELIAAQLVVEISEERFAFRHALTRQAVYAGLLTRERQTLHRRIADELEQATYPADDAHLGDLGYHYSKAASWEKALTYAQRAGERALSLYAPRAALEHLMRALEAAEHLPDAPEATLHRLCGQAYEILGDFEAARTRYGAALETARALGDRTIEWSSLVDLGNLWSGRDYTKSGTFYRQAAELAHSREDAVLYAHSLNRLGNLFANTGRTEEGIAAHRQALALFEEQKDLPGQAATLDLMGMAYGLNAELPDAVREFSRAIDLFRGLGDRHGLSHCLASRLGFGSACMAEATVSALMTLDECRSDADDAERLAREMEWSAGLAYVLLQIGRAEVAFGVIGPGLGHIRGALRIAGEIDHQQWMAGAYYALGRCYLTLLAPGRAIPELQRGLAIARTLGSEVWTGLTTADLVRAYREHGEFARARVLLSTNLPRDALWDRASLTLAECGLALQWAQLDLQRGDALGALQIVAHLHEQANRSGSDQPIAELLLAQGEALMRLRRWDSALEALERAKRGAVQRMNPSTLWRVHALLARVCHALKRSELARQEVEAAHDVLEGVAATIEEAGLRATFLQAARADIPRVARHTALQDRTPPPTPSLLTRRELEVARLVAQGKSNHEIAGDLVLSERTVTTHVSNILGKLGFTSRTQIVAWLVMGAEDMP
jgi:DNA-binding CsgD family transcriptional regulator/tetratricopeptide (TPR) repeat protein